LRRRFCATLGIGTDGLQVANEDRQVEPDDRDDHLAQRNRSFNSAITDAPSSASAAASAA